MQTPTHTTRSTPLVIGLLGGVASGKSFVARELTALGARVLDADRAGHDVLRQTEVKTALRSRWGEAVFQADGEVDRGAVGRIVFAPPPDGPTELRFLEQVSHPRITEELRRQLTAMHDAPAVVLDAAVMLKGGWDRLCDTIWFVDSPPDARRERAAQRGWSEADWAAREAAQEPLEVKRRRADRVIDNSGSPQHAAAQVQTLWRELVQKRPPEHSAK